MFPGDGARWDRRRYFFFRNRAHFSRPFQNSVFADRFEIDQHSEIDISDAENTPIVRIRALKEPAIVYPRKTVPDSIALASKGPSEGEGVSEADSDGELQVNARPPTTPSAKRSRVDPNAPTPPVKVVPLKKPRIVPATQEEATVVSSESEPEPDSSSSSSSDEDTKKSKSKAKSKAKSEKTESKPKQKRTRIADKPVDENGKPLSNLMIYKMSHEKVSSFAIDFL